MELADAVQTAVDDERALNARRVALIRFVTGTIYLVLYFVFGRLLELEAWRGGDVPLLAYAIVAAATFFAARRSPRFARRSGWLMPLVDVPAVFVLQLVMLTSASNPGAVIAFNLSTMFLFIVLASWWLSSALPIVTATLGAASQSTLFVIAGAHPAIAVSVFTLLLLGGAGCAYAAGRGARLVRSLAEELAAAEALRVAAIDLELQNQRMQETSRDKDRFLANVSHELRTPLNAIIGFGELIADGKTSQEETKEYAGDILNGARHLLSLINGILDTAQAHSDHIAIAREPTQLAAVVKDVASTLRPSADKKQIALVLDLAEDLPLLPIDPKRLRQILYNYLSNAVKFTPSGGAVTLRTKKDDAFVRLEVEDTGVGIAPADIPSLFNEFTRLRNADSVEGTGLGLALTKRIVEAHGGDVGVNSTPGKGSTFYARLPLRTSPPAPT